MFHCCCGWSAVADAAMDTMPASSDALAFQTLLRTDSAIVFVVVLFSVGSVLRCVLNRV